MTIFIISLGFFLATLVQYHTGILNLGKINAVDEGIPALALSFIFTSIVGTDFWIENEIFEIKLRDYFAAFVFIAAIIQILDIIHSLKD